MSDAFDKNIIHLLEENNSERLEDLNSVVRTLKNLSLIVANNENGSEYHYYIKVFRKNDKSIGPLQIVKYKDDGSFYVTNHRLKNKKFTNIINSGHIILDASTPTAMKETLSSVNIIISQTDSRVKSFQNANDPREPITKTLFICLKKPMHQHLCMKRDIFIKVEPLNYIKIKV